MEQTKPSAEGLRYRKKLKARLSVERAALELVIERGYDGVTVEDICARAEISKKTFFNYFPSKAAAIMGRLDSFPDDEQLVRILEEHSEACYLDVLVGVVGTGAASGVDEGIVNLRREALRSMPQLFSRSARHIGYSALHGRRFARAFSRVPRTAYADGSLGGGGGACGVVDRYRPRPHSLNADRVRRFGAVGGRNAPPCRRVPVGRRQGVSRGRVI